MTKEEIKKLFNNFLAEENVDGHEQIWKRQSEEFRKFWREKIMNEQCPSLIETEMDEVIRFFDCKARGAKEFRENGGESAARAGIHQKMWYKALVSLKNNKDIREILNQIFETDDDSLKISLINELEKTNRQNKNGLTAVGTIILTAFLFTYSPKKYLPMLSIKNRLFLVDFFELSESKQYRTYGEQVIKTKNDIISGFKEKYEISTTPIALSSFIYGCLSKNYHWINNKVDQKDIKKHREKHNNEQEELLETNKGLISPETPYTNRNNIRNLIKSCEEYIYWFDPYFSGAGLDFLFNFIDSSKVKNIKILMSDKNNIAKEDFEIFKNFKIEMKNEGVICDLRVMKQNKQHDRWIMSKNQCFNLPSTGTIKLGQWSEIKKTENRPPFEKWWDEGLDIISDWQKIYIA